MDPKQKPILHILYIKYIVASIVLEIFYAFFFAEYRPSFLQMHKNPQSSSNQSL